MRKPLFQGYREKWAFIIAQSPMENTVRDFWKMMGDQRVLCSMKEVGVVGPMHAWVHF